MCRKTSDLVADGFPKAKAESCVEQGVDGCRSSGVGCQEDCKDGGPEHCHADPLDEAHQVSKSEEEAQLRDKGDCAKENG